MSKAKVAFVISACVVDRVLALSHSLEIAASKGVSLDRGD